jgi:hypothetical protein
MLALSACSDRSAPEPVAQAEAALGPLVGPLEEGWRLPSSGDFNGDGLRDIVWRDHDGNRLAVTLMAGTRVLQQGPLVPGPPGTNWAVINAATDLNYDGFPDIIWYNQDTNRLTVWLMRGMAPFERGPEIPGPPGDGWFPLAAGDFNRDGMGDVPWFNASTKRVSVWLMRGTEPLERGPEIPGPPGDGWSALFGADLDRDGLADLFWHNATTSRITVWRMAGTEVLERGPEIPAPGAPNAKLVGVGDFNRDRMADTLWFDATTGRAIIALMWGTRILQQSPGIQAPPGPGWIAGNSGEPNGDGLADILWLNVEPVRMRVWLMGGFTPLERGPEILAPQ